MMIRETIVLYQRTKTNIRDYRQIQSSHNLILKTIYQLLRRKKNTLLSNITKAIKLRWKTFDPNNQPIVLPESPKLDMVLHRYMLLHSKTSKEHKNSKKAKQNKSTQPPGFSLGLEQSENISLPDWSLNVSHNETVLIINELDSHLSHLSSGSSATHNFHHYSMLDLGIHSTRKYSFF